MNLIKIADTVSSFLSKFGSHEESMTLNGCYYAKCYDKDGNLKWEANTPNICTTLGKNAALDAILGNSAVGANFMGLKGTGTAVLADTQASHASWSEVGGTNAPAYSGTRKSPSYSAASGSSKATSAAVAFTFTSGGTVAGCFLNIGGTNAQDNTTGTLFSAGDFTGGSKVVASTDVLNVTYTLSA